MRLWHKDLIPILPRQQLLGQWRELCAIARNIADKGSPAHVLVNKVLDYPKDDFMAYADHVYKEMRSRGYRAGWSRFAEPMFWMQPWKPVDEIYREWHNDRYLRQCLYNLQEKYDCGAIRPEEWEKITEQHPWIKHNDEPVEAELEGGGSTWWYVCGDCHGAIDSSDRFCRHCGQAVKQT